MLHFDRLHSTDVRNDEVIFRVIATDNNKYEFSITRQLAGLFTAALQAAANHLSETPHGYPLVPMAVQPMIGPKPALSFVLGGNLTVEITLPPQKLEAVKRAIALL